MAALVVIAAGMGARYGGGVKQIDAVGPFGEIIADYSVFDAARAGFDRFVFVIREGIDAAFREVFFDRISKHVNAEIVWQDMSDMPEGRKKPWGTGHAVLACKDVVNEPFMVVGADDFFGRRAFKLVYDYITQTPDDGGIGRYCMAGYILKETTTDKGTVARGVCEIDGRGFLKSVVEHTKIASDGGRFFNDWPDGRVTELNADTVVSMNVFGFKPSFLRELETRFEAFKRKNADKLETIEYFLPGVVDELIGEGKATVKVFPTTDKWYGVTYQEDRPFVQEGISTLIKAGLYPADLWGDNL